MSTTKQAPDNDAGDESRPMTGTSSLRSGDVIFTTASPLSMARALLTLRSASSNLGAIRCVVLASGTIAHRFSEFEVVRPQDVLPDTPDAFEFLDDDELVAFAEPYALARLLTPDGAIIRLAPGAFVAQYPRGLVDLLEDSTIALAAPVVVKPSDSLVPHLALRDPDRSVVSEVVVGLAEGADVFLEQWKAAMVDTAFDPLWTSPGNVTERVLASFVGNPGVRVEGVETLMPWFDYAAVRSGAATASGPTVIDTGDLWEVIKPQKRTGGDMTAAAYRLIDLRVHDLLPLAPIIDAIRSAEASDEEAVKMVPFDRLVRRVRRASDPLGLRWGPGSSETIEQWLFARNRRGLTRIADLLWYESAEISGRFPAARVDPDGYHSWSDRSLRATIGFDPFGDATQGIGPGTMDIGSEEIREAAGEAEGRLQSALVWRWNAIRSVIPGVDAARERRHARRTATDPDSTNEILVLPRVDAERVPAVWGNEPHPLSIIGCFRTESGLGQAARASVAAVRHLGIPFTQIDTSDMFASRSRIDVGLRRETHGAVGDVNLIHSNAAELITTNDDVFRHRLGGRFNAAMWFWEARNMPEWALAAFDRVDELWVASEYLADVFGQYGRVPVHVIGLASELPPDRQPDRSSFGWEDDHFVFLFVYDAFSSKGRKNPDKAMRAFIEAFGPEYGNVRLVIKVSNLSKFPADRDWLMKIAAVSPAIEVIDAYYTQDQIFDLMAAADVYVSLHAAEGYGLTLLEAMNLGTPVICTGYSGNLDFTNDENSWLVRYDLVETFRQSGPYPAGSIWAEPDVGQAAAIMRHVVENPREVSVKAAHARIAAKEAASLDRYAERLGTQLRRVL